MKFKSSLVRLTRTDILISIKTIYIFYKTPVFWNVLLFDLADQIYEFPTGKGDDMCRKKVKEEYFTFVTRTRSVVPAYSVLSAIFFFFFFSASSMVSQI